MQPYSSVKQEPSCMYNSWKAPRMPSATNQPMLTDIPLYARELLRQRELKLDDNLSLKEIGRHLKP